tara:strand:- start:242 stop:505 length:264 start_codon:yes stop_codon:yes gene_type:complete
MELYDRQAPVDLNPSSETLMPFQVLIAKYTKLPRKALPNGLNMTGAGHGQTKSPFGSHGQPAVFIIAKPSVSMTLTVGHWRQRQAIG